MDILKTIQAQLPDHMVILDPDNSNLELSARISFPVDQLSDHMPQLKEINETCDKGCSIYVNHDVVSNYVNISYRPYLDSIPIPKVLQNVLQERQEKQYQEQEQVVQQITQQITQQISLNDVLYMMVQLSPNNIKFDVQIKIIKQE